MIAGNEKSHKAADPQFETETLELKLFRFVTGFLFFKPRIPCQSLTGGFSAILTRAQIEVVQLNKTTPEMEASANDCPASAKHVPANLPTAAAHCRFLTSLRRLRSHG
jgi:hypothetical protein